MNLPDNAGPGGPGLLSRLGLRGVVVAAICAVAVPALALATYSFMQMRQNAEAAAEQQAMRVAKNAATQFLNRVELARTLLGSALDFDAESSDEECGRFMDRLRRRFPSFFNFGVFWPDGGYDCGTLRPDNLPNVLKRKSFQDSLANKRFSVGELVASHVSGMPVVIFTLPEVGSDGRVKRIGVASLDAGLFNLDQQKVFIPPGYDLTIIDVNGRALASRGEPPRAQFGGTLTIPAQDKALAENTSDAVLRGVTPNGEGCVFAITPIIVDNQIVARAVASVAEQQLFVGATRDFYRQFMVLTILTLLAGIFAWRTLRRDYLRLGKVMAAAEAVGQGDNAARCRVTGADEIGRMGAAFDEMAARLARREAERDEATARAVRESERLRAALSERESLLREIHHRVKNNLQVVSSLLSLQTRRVPESAVPALQDSRSRVVSMALAHEMVYGEENFSEVNAAAYVRRLANQLLTGARSTAEHERAPPPNAEISFDLADIRLDISKAVPFGLILTELLSNALRHGLSDDEKGRVSLALGLANGKANEVELRVANTGNPLPENFDWDRDAGMGLEICRILVLQLRGALHADSGDETVFTLTFPKN